MKINEVYTPLLKLLGFDSKGRVTRRQSPAQKRAAKVRRQRRKTYRY